MTFPESARYRVGRHLGRTVYRVVGGAHDSDHDELIGIMDTPELGVLVVEALNKLAGGGTSEGLRCSGSGDMFRPFPCGHDGIHDGHDVGLPPGQFLEKTRGGGTSGGPPEQVPPQQCACATDPLASCDPEMFPLDPETP